MKKMLAMIILIVVLPVTYGFAGMRNGMMESRRHGMMERGRMMNDMAVMTKRMSNMMGKLSDMMQDMRSYRMIRAAGLLGDMSHQMMEMSRMMKKGEVSHEEMARLHEHMREMQENPLMAHAERWEAPEAAARQHNPIPPTPASVARGRKLYHRFCMSCHGKSARGNGPAGAGLTPRPSNLRESAEDHTAGELAWKIANGRGPMPAWRNVLSEYQIWDLANFIKSLKKDRRDR